MTIAGKTRAQGNEAEEERLGHLKRFYAILDDLSEDAAGRDCCASAPAEYARAECRIAYHAVERRSAAGMAYARPDDRTANGRTWRELLIEYNQTSDNVFGLIAAYRLP